MHCRQREPASGLGTATVVARRCHSGMHAPSVTTMPLVSASIVLCMLVAAASTVTAYPAAPAAAASLPPCYEDGDFSMTLMPDGWDHLNRTRLVLNVWDMVRDRSVPWGELALTHERGAHIVMMSNDNTVFAHVHPEDFGDGPAPGDTNILISADLSAGVDWVIRPEVAVNVPRICAEGERPPAWHSEVEHVRARLRKRQAHIAQHHQVMNHQDGDAAHDHSHGQSNVHSHAHNHSQHGSGGTSVPVKQEFMIAGQAPPSSFAGIPSPRAEPLVAVHGLRLPTDSEAYTYPISLGGIQHHILHGDGAKNATNFAPWAAKHASDRIYAVAMPQLMPAPPHNVATVPAGDCKTFLLHVAQFNAVTGRFDPVGKLEPFLGAPGHITAVLFQSEKVPVNFREPPKRLSNSVQHAHPNVLSSADVPESFQSNLALLSQRATQTLLRKSMEGETSTLTSSVRQQEGVSLNLYNPATHISEVPALSTSLAIPKGIDQCGGMLMKRTPQKHGASGHHHHQPAPPEFGPWLAIGMNLPHPGMWRVVVQMRHVGEMISPSFWLRAV